MALYGTSRDVSLIRHLNRELLHDIISQQCVFYQLQATETKVNIYGESAGAKYYKEPVILNMLLDLGDISSPTGDMGVDYDLPITFKFFRDDLIDANILPKVGDIIMWYEGYWELNNVADNQLFVGKDPSYSYSTDNDNFGSSISIIVNAHLTRNEALGLTQDRL